jgi:hypothetical protein
MAYMHFVLEEAEKPKELCTSLCDTIMMIIVTRRARVYLDMYTLERLSGSASLLARFGTRHWATVTMSL